MTISLENTARLKELTASVKQAVEEYEKRDDLKSYKDLQTKVRHIQTAACSPEDTLFTFRLQVTANEGIDMALQTGVLDALVNNFTGKATAADLAVHTGCNELFIDRVMRMVCSLGFCDEAGEKSYAANRITNLIVLPGWKGALRWMELIYPVAAQIRDFTKSTNYGQGEQTPVQSAFEYVHGKSMWKVMEEHPIQRLNFDHWMHERKKHEETQWHKRFPPITELVSSGLKTDPLAVLFVDVGGATGSQMVNFRTQFPHLPGRYVLQDLPESVSGLTTPEGIEVQAYDFFTPQPVKGARFYYLRSILHNWPDDKCVDILQNLVPALDPEYSTILVDDYVLPNTDAQLRSAIADIHMMVMFNSSERTSRQYETIFRRVGLEIRSITPAGVNEECIMEVKVAKAGRRNGMASTV